MPKPKPFSSLFRKKPQTLSFQDYYTKWFKTLKKTHLPLIQLSLSSSSSPTLLHSRIDILLHHFLAYYDTLDLAASQENLPQLLFPSWRNSLEIPFLLLGDLHPYLFTNLLRSFLDQETEEGEENDSCDGVVAGLDRPWQVMMAWKNVSKHLMNHIDQIECGLRLMVPALMSRIKKVQGGFVGRIAEDWGADCEGKRERIEEAMKEAMEEMVSVFMDANRLRKSVITEIVSGLSLYQAALFLEGLAQFLVGLREEEVLGEFKRCKNSHL
ncbi:protein INAPERTURATE POLLEN1 [Pistacia vera]|uniref:protein INAPERTURATE POLLEN1 n=1 Tax=Pistacia vera TaxID=55513 RepID=UPI001262EA70|nr:protein INAPERTURATE POLLEN1 [Pistacia vera]